MDLTSSLNKRQRQAVTQLDGPVLIIAGAGSGKTRVIIYRIANMLLHGIPQSNILALTFTNKASKEMAERIKELTKKKLSNLTISTFHAFGVKVLKEQIRKLGYRHNFTIYDQIDKKSLIKEVARELNLPIENIDLNKVGNLISNIKTERIPDSELTKEDRDMYKHYQEYLKAYNAVDFDDLISLPIKIFEKHPDVLTEYQEQYKYIMVDEFQDTSSLQYKFLHLIGQKNKNVCVVGDDDQSIYSWRGANYENLLMFERDYPGVLEIKLEQNYRSTDVILSAANGLIAHNTNRKKKELWTGVGGGKPIAVFYPENERKEGEFIAQMIRTARYELGINYGDLGVLVRTNSLTSSIEEAFLAENIPYKVSGGMSFFQRKEIKDIISYLRVIANPEDDINLLRIINTPRRGIGKRTLEQLSALADKKHCSLYTALTASRFATDSPFSEKAQQTLTEFLTFIEYYQEVISSDGKGKLERTVKSLVDAIDYWGYLVQEHVKTPKVAQWKYNNILKFIQIIGQYERDPDTIDPSLHGFLNRITIITRDDNDEDDVKGHTHIMTIHSAKGLEFDVVFLAGVEEDIIPHGRALEENEKNIEEERRLFYVAITRAKKKLYLTSCAQRRVLKDVRDQKPSPFLEEIPKHLIEYHAPEEEMDDEKAKELFQNMKRMYAEK